MDHLVKLRKTIRDKEKEGYNNESPQFTLNQNLPFSLKTKKNTLSFIFLCLQTPTKLSLLSFLPRQVCQPKRKSPPFLFKFLLKQRLSLAKKNPAKASIHLPLFFAHILLSFIKYPAPLLLLSKSRIFRL